MGAPTWEETEEVKPKAAPAWDETEEYVPPDAVRSAILGAAQGGTAGFVDELAGKYADIKDWITGSEGVKAGAAASPELRAQIERSASTGDLLKQKMREEAAAAQEYHPAAYMAGEAAGATGLGVLSGHAGGLASKLTGLRVPVPVTPWGRIGMGVAEGAGSGAVYGAGTSEATDALGVAKDAGMGALFGGAAGGVGSAIGVGVDKLRDLAKRGAAKAVEDQLTREAANKAEKVAQESGRLGGDSAAAVKTYKEALETAADESMPEGLRDRARAILQDPDLRAAVVNARENYVTRAPEQLGKLRSGREAMAAAKAIDVDAAAAEGLSGPVRKHLWARSKTLLGRAAPIGAFWLGNKLDMPEVGAGAAAILAMSRGQPAKIIGNALRQPGVRKMAFEGMLKVLRENPVQLGKFAQPLLNASKRGPDALAAAHFVLAQRHPEYRDQTDRLADSDHHNKDATAD